LGALWRSALLSAVLRISGLFGLCNSDNLAKRQAWRLAGCTREPLVRPSGHPTHHQPHGAPELGQSERSPITGIALEHHAGRNNEAQRNDGLAPPAARAPALPFVADDPLLLRHGQVHPVVPITLAVFVYARVEEALPPGPALGLPLAVVLPLLVALRIAVVVLGKEDMAPPRVRPWAGNRAGRVRRRRRSAASS
jgi:hypothetical protein